MGNDILPPVLAVAPATGIGRLFLIGFVVWSAMVYGLKACSDTAAPDAVAPDYSNVSASREGQPVSRSRRGLPPVRPPSVRRPLDTPANEARGRTAQQTVVTLVTWTDPITATLRATRTLLLRGGAVTLRTQYSDGTSSTEQLIERPSARPNERRFDVEPHNDQSEYITVTDSGMVRWFAWDGTSFLTQRASSIHADFLELGADSAQRDCTPKQLSPTSREIVTLYEQLQDFKDDPDFSEFGFSVGGPYHQWMEDATKVLAASSPDEVALQLDHLGFTGGDVMNLGLSYLNPEHEDEKRNILDSERRIRAGLVLARCDSSVSVHN